MQVVLQQNSIEIHEEGELAAAEAEISTRLRLMHRQDALDRLQLEKNGVCDDDIGKIGLVQTEVFIDEGQGDFPFEFQAGVFQFSAEAMVIGSFEQAGAKLSVDLDGEADNAAGQRWAGFLGGHRGSQIQEGRCRMVNVAGGSRLAAGISIAKLAETQRAQRKVF